MPIISVFLGIIVRVFHGDHNPPHIHVQYGDQEAVYDVQAIKPLEGKLPRRVHRIVLEWIKQ